MFRLIRNIKNSLIGSKNKDGNYSGEKRRHSRVKVPPLVDVAFLEGADSRFGDGNVLDISESGVHFVADGPVAHGAALIVTIHFPRAFQHRVPLKVRATVARCHLVRSQRVYSIGCTFSDLEPASHEVLHTFMRWAASLTI